MGSNTFCVDFNSLLQSCYVKTWETDQGGQGSSENRARNGSFIKELADMSAESFGHGLSLTPINYPLSASIIEAPLNVRTGQDVTRHVALTALRAVTATLRSSLYINSPPDLPVLIFGKICKMPQSILIFFESFRQLVTFSISAVASG